MSVTVILFFVRVPVLSEQMTETEPRVSTVFSDLHRILFFRMIFATMVKDVVRAMGNPSGMTAQYQRGLDICATKEEHLQATAAETQLTIRRGTSIQVG
jgi:hypothetical protein